MDNKLHRLFVSLIGSRAYGTDNPDSDWDWRGCYMARNDELLGLFPPADQIDTKDKHDDTTYYELGKLVRLLVKGNPNTLEIVHSPHIIVYDQCVEPLLANKHLFVTRAIIPVYEGYAHSQEHKLRGSIDSGKPDKKNAVHCIRLMLGLEAALLHKKIVVNIAEFEHIDCSSLLELVRTPEPDWNRYWIWWQQIVDRIEAAKSKSALVGAVDMEHVNNLLLEIRRSSR